MRNTLSRLASRRRSSQTVKVLWRGMRNIYTTDAFLEHGGSELAPCSTTPNLEVAIRYAKDWDSKVSYVDRALIFRVLVDSFMHQGPDLRFLSVFPHEQEALYPPLTYFKPCGKVERIVYSGTEFTIVDVKPTFPT